MRKVKSGPKGGRPRFEPTADDVAKVHQLARIQCNYKEIGAVLGVSERTVKNLAADHEEFGNAIRTGWAQASASFKRLLWKHAETGNAKALGLLAARFGMDEKMRVEHTGKGGGPIEHKGLTQEAADTIRRTVLGLGVEDERPDGEKVH